VVSDVSTKEIVTEEPLTPEELAQLPVSNAAPMDVELEEEYNVDVANTEPPTMDAPEHNVPKRPQDLAHEAWALLQNNAVWLTQSREWWIQRDGIWRKDVDDSVRGRIMYSVVLNYKPKASDSFVGNIERMTRTMLATDPSKFDRHPWLLGVGNGVVDLHTGKLSSASSQLYITRAAPTDYVPSAKCPTWLAHLDHLFAGNEEHISFFQKAIGAALVGDSNQKPQIFVFLIGDSGSGKGAAGRALAITFGQDQHTINISADDLTVTGFNRHKQWLTRFHNARIVLIEEVERHTLNMSLIKKLSGGDTVTANEMYRMDKSWRPTHSMFLTSNDPPDFGGDVTGMPRRYMPIPTGERITPKPGYEMQLASETEGILAWAVEGNLRWQEEDGAGDIPMSPEMIEMQTQHLEGNDEFAELITNSWLVFEPDWKASRAQIRKAFEDHLTTDTKRRPDITPPEKAELTRLYQWIGNQPGVRALGTVHFEDGTRDRGWVGVGVGKFIAGPDSHDS
jgi:P4 family phage/plasmid primase-like protien